MKTRRSFTREETRARIMETADQLFRQFGSSKTTVTDIAQELGMSSANIYKFFASKDAIVEASAERSVGRLKDKLLAVLRNPGSAGERLEQLVLALIQFNRDTFRNEGQAYKLFLACVEQNWACVRTFNEDFNKILATVVDEGVSSGEFRPVDAKATAIILHDCMKSVMHPLLARQVGDENIERRALAVVRFLADALR